MAVYLDHAGRPLPQKLAKSDGIRFHYIRGGKGPTVVLIAGFPQSVYAWRRVIPLLTDAYDVIALDLPGQGDSDKPLDGYDTATAAKRINGFLKTIGNWTPLFRRTRYRILDRISLCARICERTERRRLSRRQHSRRHVEAFHRCR
ncbi:alpha/beta fold hydrolase [Tardiphaga sp. 866_E4_N2_1]|uniref:alpha/beta fold hydrolase n=1 Tax=unclassified Tardiphaga TaxID=2631404 RepID=UPI003F27AA27